MDGVDLSASLQDQTEEQSGRGEDLLFKRGTANLPGFKSRWRLKDKVSIGAGSVCVSGIGGWDDR